MSYTTEDCKNFLIAQYKNSQKSDWKRVKKYKDENLTVCRDFINSSTQLIVTLKETPKGLINYTDVLKLLNPAAQITPAKTPISNILFGGGITSTQHLSLAEDKFVNVIETGIDWSAPEGQRSSSDFSKQVNFNNLVKSCPNLLFKYIAYIDSATSFILDLDETYMPQHVISSDFDDSIVDLKNVLDDIVEAYKKNKMSTKVPKKIVDNILSTFDEIHKIAYFGDSIMQGDVEDVFTEISYKLRQLV